MSRTPARVTQAPRLMTKAEAASYCRMSPAMFEKLCPVVPLRFSDRVTLFDVDDIDAWIDRTKNPAKAKLTRDWLAEMDSEN